MLLKLLKEKKLDNVDDDLPSFITWKEIDEVNYAPNIPDGYRYCDICGMFTPYEEMNDYYNDISVCRVCENETNIEYMCECGHGFDIENVGYNDRADVITLHKDGCHCKDEVGIGMFYINSATYREYISKIAYNNGYFGLRLNATCYADVVLGEFIESLSLNDIGRLNNQLLELINDDKCNCERVKVFPVTELVKYSSHSVYSMDCINAVEWDMIFKCPICNRLFYHSDGNC